jgi:hypothetical protein
LFPPTDAEASGEVIDLRREIYAKEIKFAQMGVKYFIQVTKNYR